jgi:hypothetical protein
MAAQIPYLLNTQRIKCKQQRKKVKSNSNAGERSQASRGEARNSLKNILKGWEITKNRNPSLGRYAFS